MNLTDNEIIKALECCIESTSRNDCEDLCCPACEEFGCYFMNKSTEDYPDSLIQEICKSALDLINRLQSKNKEFDEKIVIQMGTIDWQAKEINRQRAEIERLQKAGKESVDCFTRMETLYKIKCKELEVAKSSAIKEFAEKLKEEFKPDPNYEKAVNFTIKLFRNFIDNLVKEMVGD